MVMAMLQEASSYGMQSGMTLRDYFAAKAMPVVWAEIPEDYDRVTALRRLGYHCYEMADAMLKARGS